MNTRFRIFNGGLLAATTLIAGALSGPAIAAELVYGSWIPEAEYTNRVALPKAFAEIKEQTGVEWRLVPGGQLVNPVGTWDAVESGLVQGGMGIPQYVPSVVPNINTIYQTVLPGDFTLAATGAALETMYLDCPSCMKELKDQNIVALSGWDTSPYYLGCTKEVSSLDDLKGLKVRAAGGSVRLMEALGATPVAATLVEAINLLQTGGLDCVFGVANWYRSFGYADFVKYHVNVPLGITGPATGWIMNRDAWLDLSEEAKDLHIKKGAMVSAMQAQGQFVEEATDTLKWAVDEKGVTVVDPADSDAFIEVMNKFVVDQDAATVEASKAAGVEDPQAIIDAYRANFEKWKDLVKDIDSIDALTDLYYNEIYSKLDLSNF
jgi:TRAP-type C4-dicarboxylate transport system substrate-binding protein